MLVVSSFDPPAPPPGPGVAPPFAAPPVDRSRRGLWIGLGAGGLVALLCCVGGVIGLAVLGTSVNREMEVQTRKVTIEYLDALRDADYDTAWELRCPALKARQSRSGFAATERAAPRPVAYTLGRVQIGQAAVVPVNIRYDTGVRLVKTFTLVPDSATSELKVCRITG